MLSGKLHDVQGTAKRWEVVTAYVRTRTTEEVLDMVKLGLKSRQSKAKADQFSIAKKRQANTSIKSDPTGRMESFSDVDINLSGMLFCAAGHLVLHAGPCRQTDKPVPVQMFLTVDVFGPHLGFVCEVYCTRSCVHVFGSCSIAFEIDGQR